ncbi:MAG: hypothetical protein ABJ239_04315 [Erythrobacter sp.]
MTRFKQNPTVGEPLRFGLTRRTAIAGGLGLGVAAAIPLAGCSGNGVPEGATRVTVLGTIHSRHRDSRKYSLAVLREAIRRAKPDIILTEIPPGRIAMAKSSFAETGAVTEERTARFPEYTDVIFPLSREMDFDIVGAAGWTQEIADNRRAALKQIENNPVRAQQWEQHLAARRTYAQKLAGRGDDPVFIHSDEYDGLVEKAQAPYQRYFDGDLGAGGWTQINRAHTNLINSALGEVQGKGLKALVTFGSWHKYIIKRSLRLRKDVVLMDTAPLFA